MRQVREYLSRKQSELVAHPFFAQFEAASSFEETMDFAPGLTFWVFAFQDILRLNESRVDDPVLRRIARHHRSEDRGHDNWFLQDVAVLDPTPRDFRWLFGPTHVDTRDAAYALVSEVFKANDDYTRIALLLTLESSGHVFFGKLASYVAKNDNGDHNLRYFSNHHLEVEKEHELFEAEMMKQVDIPLPETLRAEIIAMIDRCYLAFEQIFSGLEKRSRRRAEGNRSLPPPKGVTQT